MAPCFDGSVELLLETFGAAGDESGPSSGAVGHGSAGCAAVNTDVNFSANSS